MKNILSTSLFIAAIISACELNAQVALQIEWAKCFGGSNDDEAFSIQKSPDGGFIIAGFAGSNDGDVLANHSGGEYWILKLDSLGNLLWQKSFGGSFQDRAEYIQPTVDGGYIIAGSSWCDDGDITAHHGSTFTTDAWIVKIDSIGNLLWEKSLGGDNWEKAYCIKNTTDGGYIVGASANGNGGDVSGWHPGYNSWGFANYDYWIVRLDSVGNIIWQKCLGGSGIDDCRSIQETNDGGCIAAGFSFSDDGDVSDHHGLTFSADYWVVRLDASGNIIWKKSFGGNGNDPGCIIQQTNDGGFIVSGSSSSSDGDITAHIGYVDYWIVKLDSSGNLLWEKSLGGTNEDIPWEIKQTADSGYIVCGSSRSDDVDLTANYGNADCWVVKLDQIGDLEWQKSFGGYYEDNMRSILQISDSAFITAGVTASNDYDVSGNHGEDDFWVVKLSNNIATSIHPSYLNTISFLHPNPVQNLLTIDLASKATDATIRVYDLQGRMIALPITIHSESAPSATNTRVQLNTTTLPNGFYTLQIRNNKTGEFEVNKFVKQGN